MSPTTDNTVQQENTIEAKATFQPLKSHAHAMVVCGDSLCVAGKDTTVKVSISSQSFVAS